MASKRWTKDRLLNELEQSEAHTEALSLTNHDLSERIAELELGLEDQDWVRLSSEPDHDLSREGIRRIASLSRLFFLKNPLVGRAVETQAYYVFGQGVEFSAKNEQFAPVLESFIKDIANQRELTSHQARIDKEKELQVEGNLFFTFFTSPQDGTVKIRTIPAREINTIVSDPNDAKTPLWYQRIWNVEVIDPRTGTRKNERMEAYYPDIYAPIPETGMPDVFAGKPVQPHRVYHVKTGGLPDMKFGVPETYASIDWARAYKTFLENWATIQRALSRFAARMTTRGGSAGVASAKSTLETTQQAGSTEDNPPPVTGATIVTTPEGVMFEPIRTAGMTTGPEEGRRLLLMVAAATGLPETFFGDLSQGNHATALTMDRPTELKMVERRNLWSGIFQVIFDYVFTQSAIASRMDDTEFQAEDMETDTAVDITWPPILEHEIDKQLSAIEKAMAMRAIPERVMSQLVLAAFGIENTEEVLDELYPGDEGKGRPEPEQEEVPATTTPEP